MSDLQMDSRDYQALNERVAHGIAKKLVSPQEEKTSHIPSISDIVDLHQLQEVQDAFAQATGLASTITDIYGDPNSVTASARNVQKSYILIWICMGMVKMSHKRIRPKDLIY